MQKQERNVTNSKLHACVNDHMRKSKCPLTSVNPTPEIDGELFFLIILRIIYEFYDM